VTGSGFDRARFEALWGDVTHFLTSEAGASAVPPRAARVLRRASRVLDLPRQKLKVGCVTSAPRTTRQTEFAGFWDRPLPGLLEALGTSPAG